MSSKQPGNTFEPKVKLFRQKALTFNQAQFLGGVNNSTPALSKYIALSSLVFFVIVISFVFFGHYAFSAHVKGRVKSSDGLIQVSSSRPGVLTKLLVHEGEKVSSGQVLATIEGTGTLDDQVSVAEEVLASLDGQINTVQSSLAQIDKVAESEHLINEAEIYAAAKELEVINDKIQGLDVQLASQKKLLNILLPLAKDFAITTFQLENQREKITSTEIDLKTLKSEADSSKKQTSILLVNADKIKQKRDLQQSELSRDLAELRRQRALASIDRRSLVIAPVSGTVASINAAVGEHILEKTFLTILPGAGLLDIELVVSERDVMFMNKGDQVWIRYAAVPYQQYGDFPGRVTSIGQIPIIDTLATNDTTPHYKVIVSTESLISPPSVAGIRFFPGFQVEVALTGESKRIVNWLVDPIRNSIKGH